MVVATTFFWLFAKKLFKKELPSFIATLIMVLLTSLPWLEGNIPNGELFVLGFVIVGAFLFSQTQIWQNFFSKKISWPKEKKKESLLLFASGVLFSLGILTKVPALLDLVPFLSIFALLLLADALKVNKTFKDWQRLAVNCYGDYYISLLALYTYFNFYHLLSSNWIGTRLFGVWSFI
jgi:4-amino-4-deoxy-L-arabinose transferase-like glycosyltransferase